MRRADRKERDEGDQAGFRGVEREAEGGGESRGLWKRNKYVGVSLVGKTLAVMGFGKVGSEVARRAKGLGMHVIAHDPYAPADRARAIGVDLVSFDQAISTADFVSLHMPLTPTTTKVFNDDTFSKMKKGVRIINVARGGVIDEDALVRALDSGVVAQAALDVFTEEPPSKESKLVQHENVTVTPHLGASTKESQEGVAIEIAEAVVGALQGELSATAVNAPMVPPEVMSELSPYVVLAEKLGKLVVQLVAGGSGITSVRVVYKSARDPDDLDTRLLRAMITKGIIEPISTSFINLVNADFVAKQKGLRISEEKVTVDSSPEFPVDSIQVHISNVDSKFASSVSENGSISIEGKVKYGEPHLTCLGSFGVDVSLEGNLILCRQVDQPGMIGKVGNILGTHNVNVSFMSVGRTILKKAIMAIGVDEEPSKETLMKIGDVSAIEERRVTATWKRSWPKPDQHQASTALDQPSSSSTFQQIKTSTKFFNKLVENQQAPNTRFDSPAIKQKNIHHVKQLVAKSNQYQASTALGQSNSTNRQHDKKSKLKPFDSRSSARHLWIKSTSEIKSEEILVKEYP
ncbi:hypothetical protein ACLB2K_058800 [Fragaria x ananassa]